LNYSESAQSELKGSYDLNALERFECEGNRLLLQFSTGSVTSTSTSASASTSTGGSGGSIEVILQAERAADVGQWKTAFESFIR
jgi:hypothetical protein